MMLLAIAVSILLSLLAHVLLHGRVDEELLSDRVSSQLPPELVAKALNVIEVGGVVDDSVVVLLQLTVVFGDGFGDSRR